MDTKNTDTIIEQLRDVSDLKTFAQTLLWSIANEFGASQGAFFIAKKRDDINILSFVSGYAYHIPETETIEFEFGEGLSGQVAKEGNLMNISTVPDGYISIVSGLGEATPNSIIIFPIKNDDKVVAVIELASFKVFEKEDEAFILELSSKVETLISKLIIDNK